MADEPTEMENDLETRLRNTITRCNLALFLIEQQRQEFLPTVLELMYDGAHLILEKYCIYDNS